MEQQMIALVPNQDKTQEEKQQQKNYNRVDIHNSIILHKLLLGFR